MTKAVIDVMTRSPQRCEADATAADAARLMRDDDIGDVIVCDGDELVGILTDRDIVTRVVAEGKDPGGVKLGDVCSRDLTTVAPQDDLEQAVRLMRERALRRLPVVADGQAVGIVSLGDLAVDLDPGSALADISAAPANS